MEHAGSPEAQAIVPDVWIFFWRTQDAGDEMSVTWTLILTIMDTMEGKASCGPTVSRERRGGNWYRSSGKFREPVLKTPALGSRGLADYAAVGRYDFVELVGLCTDICVISNAMLIEAAVPDTSIQVDGSTALS